MLLQYNTEKTIQNLIVVESQFFFILDSGLLMFSTYVIILHKSSDKICKNLCLIS